MRVFEEGVDKVSDVFGVEYVDSGLVGDRESWIRGYLLEKVAYLRTIWYCGSISNLSI